MQRYADANPDSDINTHPYADSRTDTHTVADSYADTNTDPFTNAYAVADTDSFSDADSARRRQRSLRGRRQQRRDVQG